MDRRKFIKTGIAGAAGLSIARSSIAGVISPVSNDTMVDQVKLGNTGMTVSRIAMGTGTVGYNKGSNQTRLGMENFVRLARHGYERGIRFYDMADSYGSQPFVGESVKGLPRENVILSTKIWTHPNDSDRIESVEKVVDRMCSELGSDYIDILLMHCMTSGDWTETRTHYMEGLSRAKQDGKVKAVGVSCHNLQALEKAAEHPWVDVIMARINPFGSHMDGDIEVIKNVLAKAQANGKGIVGMKIFGEGKHITDSEREQSIRFALTEGNIDSMTLGLESIAQMDDAIERVMRNKQS